MPSGPSVVKELSALGLDGAFMTGVVKRGRAAKHYKTSSKGGGSGTAHWEASDYGHLIASLAADQPSDAIATVGVLYPLQLTHAWMRPEEGEDYSILPSSPEEITFGAFLEGSIRRIASLAPQDFEGEKERAEFGSITMSVEPPQVNVDVLGEAGRITYRFAAPRKVLFENQNALLDFNFIPRTRLWRWRTTEIPYLVLVTCAELLARNPANNGEVPSDGEALAGADPESGDAENDDAPDLAGSGASEGLSEVRSNQSRLLDAPGQSDASEDREAGSFAQQRIPVSGWVPPNPSLRGTPAPCPASLA